MLSENYSRKIIKSKCCTASSLLWRWCWCSSCCRLVSAMLASGLTLDEIPCGKYGTLDRYIPDGDYIVIKFARWAFEKFKGVEDKLGTQMRAVGEVMSICKNYKEAFQKAIRSLETGRYGLGHVKNFDRLSKEELLKRLATSSSERHFLMYEALRKGATVEEIFELTKVKSRWRPSGTSPVNP